MPTLLPRFWSPYIRGIFHDETVLGIVTGGVDPLFRHAYGADLHVGLDTDRVGYRGFYQYDRFRPTLVATIEDTSDPVASSGYFRTQELNLGASVPVMRSFRLAQTLSFDYRRRRETLADNPKAREGNLGAWKPFGRSRARASSRTRFHRSRAFASSSPTRRRVLGSVPTCLWVRAPATCASTRACSERTTRSRCVQAVALTFGSPNFTQSYAIGGFPDASLLDLVRTNPVVLRGYPDNAFRGRSLVYGNVEYRVPLAHPQRGLRSYPVFLRHLHASASFDAGDTWNDAFRWSDVKKSAGGALGADWGLFNRVLLTTLLGVAHGFDARGETQVYFRTGLSF